jgi:hypothetical protein
MGLPRLVVNTNRYPPVGCDVVCAGPNPTPRSLHPFSEPLRRKTRCGRHRGRANAIADEPAGDAQAVRIANRALAPRLELVLAAAIRRSTSSSVT